MVIPLLTHAVVSTFHIRNGFLQYSLKYIKKHKTCVRGEENRL